MSIRELLPENLRKAYDQDLEQAKLPGEVKMTELQREQLLMSKQDAAGNCRASCYALTVQRIREMPSFKDKIEDTAYIINQADILYKFINEGKVPAMTEFTGSVVALTLKPVT